jgi:hypothetical protein
VLVVCVIGKLWAKCLARERQLCERLLMDAVEVLAMLRRNICLKFQFWTAVQVVGYNSCADNPCSVESSDELQFRVCVCGGGGDRMLCHRLININN